MKPCSKHLPVLLFASVLGLTSLTATAATSNLDSSPVFNAKSNTSFNSKIDLRSHDFSNQFYSSTNDSNPSIGAGLNDRDQFEFANLRSDTSDGYPQQWNTVMREIGNGHETNFHHDIFHHDHDDYRFTPPPVPEPAEYLLITCGFVLLYFVARRRRISIHASN